MLICKVNVDTSIQVSVGSDIFKTISMGCHEPYQWKISQDAF